MVDKTSEIITRNMQELSIAKETGDRSAEGRACCMLGNAYQSLGEFKQAIEYHKQYLSIAKEMGHKAAVGAACCNLGNAHRHLGDFEKAIEYHEQDLCISKELGDRAGEATAYGNLGNVYNSLGDYKQAIEYHNQLLDIANEREDRASEGVAYSNLGNAHRNLGDFKKAVEYHGEHLKVAEKVGDRDGEGRACGNLGNAHHGLGEFEEAVEYHKRHLDIAKELGDRAGEGSAYCNLGSVYRQLGDFKQALQYHQQGLQHAQEVGDRAGEGISCGNLGNVYNSLGDYEQAIEYHKRHLAIANELGNSAVEGVACYSLGWDFESSGSLLKAVDCYQLSVDFLDVARSFLQSQAEWKISFRDHYRVAYTALWRTLLRLQKTTEALSAAEHGRAQALIDSLKMQYDFTTSPTAASEPKETIDYISSNISTQIVFVALLENTINYWVLGKGNDIQYIKKEIKDESANEDPVAMLMETTFKEIGAGIDVRCENRSLDEDDSPPSDSEVDSKKEELLHCTKNDLRPLHDIVIGPVADLIQDDELVIVPDGSLCLAPFAALSESIRIRVVPSLTSLKLIADSPEDYHCKSGALLVGDPCLTEVMKKRGKPMYSPLKYAREEVEMIGEIIKTSPLTGRDATKNEVLKRITSVALVHIATHGRRETGEIALAPNPERKSKIPKEEDYMLKISDVQEVLLRARLVVLSCCHSGRGEVKAEGVVGIARAFLAAGARAVLVSLWAIDDHATMEFMKRFYQHLRERKSASEALHQAMKWLRESERFGAVKYWAPFVLIGDDVTLEL